MRTPGIKPQKQVSTKWTPELAYAVGLITTDGCLSKDGRHIDFTSQDLQLVKLFKRCLNLKRATIGTKMGSFSGKRCPRIQFGDINFYRWLIDIGLTPNKSLTLSSIKIPDRFFFDFLRGCFDGDGTIYAYWDPRWHSSYMYYLKFASGSPRFLNWLNDTITRLAHTLGTIKLMRGRCYELVFAKKGTRLVFDKIFYTTHLPCLKRKYVKAQKIFRIDDSHDNAQVSEPGRRSRLRA